MPPVAPPVTDLTPPVGGDDLPGDVLPDSVNALQTGPDVGPSYAGGMVYDKFSNALFVTGATYGWGLDSATSTMKAGTTSSCFYGAVILPTLQWKNRETFGTSQVTEACNAVSMTSYAGKSAAIVVGSTEEGGLMTALGEGNTAKQYGIALDITTNSGNYELVGGALMDGSNVQFPVQVVSDDENRVWIASMSSKDDKVTADYQKVAWREYPNLTTGGIEKYGSKYTFVVEQMTLNRTPGSTDVIQETLTVDWRKPFETADLESVFVSGMILTNGGKELVVVGSTDASPTGSDMDGIIAKINVEDGSFFAEGTGARSVAYFASVTGRDDWIMQACPDKDDESAFYVVGATKGKIDSGAARSDEDQTVHAVVAKINVKSLTAVWTKQFSVTHGSGAKDKEAAAAALGCDVIQGEGAMYVAGVVENGATIDYGIQKSAGNDDIFVAMLNTNDGSTRWLHQVGSNGDDRVARGGGVVADLNGNAVVFGDTTGSFYRSKAQDSNLDISDLFVMVFDQATGSYLPPLEAPPMKDTSAPHEWYPNAVKNFKDPKTLAYGITALVLLLVACLIFFVGRSRRRKEAESQKSNIFTYLQQFDVEDVDLRKSPPGGWHGTYLNKLSYGINQSDGNKRLNDGMSSPEQESVSLTHSSVVKDSLFMDTASTPSLGYSDNPDNGAGGLNYEDGSYDDLKPRNYEDQKTNLKEII
jgi:hypothetical protein